MVGVTNVKVRVGPLSTNFVLGISQAMTLHVIVVRSVFVLELKRSEAKCLDDHR